VSAKGTVPVTEDAPVFGVGSVVNTAEAVASWTGRSRVQSACAHVHSVRNVVASCVFAENVMRW